MSFEDQKSTGYSVSLQLTRLVQHNIGSVTMNLYESKKRYGKYEKGREVPCWLHTPDKPLLKRMVLRNVVLVIRKAVLKRNTLYLAPASVLLGLGKRTYKWTFTTGWKRQTKSDPPGKGKLTHPRRTATAPDPRSANEN